MVDDFVYFWSVLKLNCVGELEFCMPCFRVHLLISFTLKKNNVIPNFYLLQSMLYQIYILYILQTI
jgi:hypothetical protein